jgi:quinol monooxygenase YgiN
MPIIRTQGTMTCDPEHLPEVESIFQTFIANVRANEPGVLTYHYFVDDDPLVIHVIEEYENPEVMLEHYANLDGPAVGRLLELVELGPMHYYGEPTANERELLAGFGTVHYHRPLASIETAPTPN